jgi:Flp pilus assembly protein TadG
MFNMHSRTSGKVSGSGRMFRRRGGAVLEMALTLSILFSICYGLIECGYYFYVKNTMEGAAREGCRAGIVTGATISNCNSVIENQLQAAGLIPNNTTASAGSTTFTMGNFTITYTDTTPAGVSSTITTLASANAGDTLTVQITATWGTVGQGFRPAAIIGAAKTVSTASAMRKEG